MDKWQDAISQNLANSSTPGYKSVNVAMNSKQGAPADFDSVLGTATVDPKTQINYSKGAFVQTDEPLSCAIEGDGYFQVQTPEGGVKYTRNGQFHLDTQGRLVSSDGETVMGKSGPITATTGAGQVSIKGTGAVYQGETQIGELAVSKISDTSKLVPAGGGYALPADAAEAGVTAVDSPHVLQGVYEMSNVSAMREMVNMIIVSRAYEANSRVVTSQDSSLGKAIQAFSA
jgi:flagellar basal body rod protein FlgG